MSLNDWLLQRKTQRNKKSLQRNTECSPLDMTAIPLSEAQIIDQSEPTPPLPDSNSDLPSDIGDVNDSQLNPLMARFLLGSEADECCSGGIGGGFVDQMLSSVAAMNQGRSSSCSKVAVDSEETRSSIGGVLSVGSSMRGDLSMIVDGGDEVVETFARTLSIEANGGDVEETEEVEDGERIDMVEGAVETEDSDRGEEELEERIDMVETEEADEEVERLDMVEGVDTVDGQVEETDEIGRTNGIEEIGDIVPDIGVSDTDDNNKDNNDDNDKDKHNSDNNSHNDNDNNNAHMEVCSPAPIDSKQDHYSNGLNDFPVNSNDLPMNNDSINDLSMNSGVMQAILTDALNTHQTSLLTNNSSASQTSNWNNDTDLDRALRRVTAPLWIDNLVCENCTSGHAKCAHVKMDIICHAPLVLPIYISRFKQVILFIISILIE